MKYLVDKALSQKSVSFLNEKGFEAIRVNKAISEDHVKDEQIFSFAIEKKYVIITMDLDFGQILAITKSNQPSTIILRLEDPRVKNVNDKLLKILPIIQKELLEGSIVIIEENGIRIRKLPINAG